MKSFSCFPLDSAYESQVDPTDPEANFYQSIANTVTSTERRDFLISFENPILIEKVTLIHFYVTAGGFANATTALRFTADIFLSRSNMINKSINNVNFAPPRQLRIKLGNCGSAIRAAAAHQAIDVITDVFEFQNHPLILLKSDQIGLSINNNSAGITGGSVTYFIKYALSGIEFESIDEFGRFNYENNFLAIRPEENYA